VTLQAADGFDDAAGRGPEALVAAGARAGIGGAAEVAVNLGLEPFGGGAGAGPVPDLLGADPPLKDRGQVRGDRRGSVERPAGWYGQAADLGRGHGQHGGGDAQQQRGEAGLVDMLLEPVR
jgi:hypothetical protein